MDLALHVPFNPTTGHVYQGKNMAQLMEVCEENGFCGQFATFRQWLSVGRCVVKGERSKARLRYIADPDGDHHADGRPKSAGQKAKRPLKGFSVFAVEQTAPLDEDQLPDEVSPLVGPASKSMAQGAPPMAPVAPKAQSHGLKARMLRKAAERFKAKAEECFAPRMTNTPKRLGQAMSKRMDGDRLVRRVAILEGLAQTVEDGQELPEELCTITSREVVTATEKAAMRETEMVANGFHGYYVETDQPSYNDPLSVALRGCAIDGQGLEDHLAETERIQAEAALRQSDFPGFFPTPAAVASMMTDLAGDLVGCRVLEPSAGMGDLCQAAFDAGAKTVKAFEVVSRLDAHLRFVETHQDQVLSHQNADFLELDPPTNPNMAYDVVLMNPPFERDQAPRHVGQALRWLRPDTGRLVSVMPANWASKRAGEALVALLDEHGALWDTMDVENGAFSGVAAFRQTGVSVQLLIVRQIG